MIRNWIFRPAYPWQFWLPQSGFFGGFILATLVFILSFISGWVLA